MRLRHYCLNFCLLLLLFGNYHVVFAHSELVSSEPKAGEKSADSPTQLKLVFNEEIKDGKVTIVADNFRTVTTTVQIDGKELLGTVGEVLPAGHYSVEYGVISADGDPVSGVYSFEIVPKRTFSTTTALGMGVLGVVIGFGIRWGRSRLRRGSRFF